jgi:hypothetical protein
MSEGRELIGRAAEAVERIRAVGRADAASLQPVLAAVLAETSRNRFRAATMLAALTAEYAEARAAVATLAADPRAHVRRRAMRCLGRDTPREFAAELLRKGLAALDPGARMKAASVAGFVGLGEVVTGELGAEPPAATDQTLK